MAVLAHLCLNALTVLQLGFETLAAIRETEALSRALVRGELPPTATLATTGERRPSSSTSGSTSTGTDQDATCAVCATSASGCGHAASDPSPACSPHSRPSTGSPHPSHLSRPEPGGVDVGDGVLGDLALL